MKVVYCILFFSMFALTVHAQEPSSSNDTQQNVTSFKTRSLSEIPNDKFGKLVRRGYSLFVNSQQMRKKYVGNDLNCVNCHLDAGRKANSAPLWAAFVSYPAYRKKNHKVNSFSERLQGCFRYSMNGTPPKEDAPELLALSAYSYWLVMGGLMDQYGLKGKPVPAIGKKNLIAGGLAKDFPMPKEIAQHFSPKTLSRLLGRGYVKLAKPEQVFSVGRGKEVYNKYCSTCHAKTGQGVYGKDGIAYIPPLWGDKSYNWGAGMHKVGKLAGFAYYNMPLVKTVQLTNQEAWDVAAYVNSHSRPEDPRFQNSVDKTAEKYHKHDGFYKKSHKK